MPPREFVSEALPLGWNEILPQITRDPFKIKDANTISNAASLITPNKRSIWGNTGLPEGLKKALGNTAGIAAILEQVGTDISDYQQLTDRTDLNSFNSQLRGINQSIWGADFGSSEDIMQANMFANPNNANYTYKDRTFGQDAAQVGKDMLSGAAIGTTFMPGIGTVIGAGVGAVSGIVKDITGHISNNKQNRAAEQSYYKALIDNNKALHWGIDTYNTKNNMMQDFSYKDMGGPLSHGTLWPDNIVLVDAGGTHEANPYGGVLMGMDEQGTPNLVEEGEVIYNDYVFSNRLKVPKNMRNKYKFGGKKPMTYADFIKASPIFKSIEEMPNDRAVRASFDSFLGDLAMSQEELRAKDAAKQRANRFDWGGPFYNGDDFVGFLNWIKDFSNLQRAGNAGGNKYRFNNKMTDKVFLGDFASREALEASDRYKNFSEQIKSALNGNDEIAKALAMRYMQAYDESVPENARGRVIKNGKLTDNWEKEYDKIRTYMLGSGHLSGDFDKMVSTFKQRLGNYNPLQIGNYSTVVDDSEVEEEGLPIGAPKIGKAPEDPQKSKNDWADLTALRYAPLFGNAAALFDNWINPIDYSNVNRYENYALGIPMATTHPIGNYMEEAPFDINYAANREVARAGNRERLIADLSGGNSASARANLIASDYGEKNDLGNLLINAYDSNLKQKQFANTFNRETDKYNSEDAFRTQSTNVGIWNTKLNALMRGAAERDAYDARYSAAKSANKTAFFDNLGNLGREEFIFNQLDNPMLLYNYLSRKGNIGYVGSKGGLLTVKKCGRK